MNRLNHKNSLGSRIAMLVALSAGSIALASRVGGQEQLQALSVATAASNIDLAYRCNPADILVRANNLAATAFEGTVEVVGVDGTKRTVTIAPNTSKIESYVRSAVEGKQAIIKEGGSDTATNSVNLVCEDGTTTSTSTSSTSTTLISATTTTRAQEVTPTTHAPLTIATSNTMATVTTVGRSPSTTVTTLGGQAEAIQKPAGTIDLSHLAQTLMSNGVYYGQNNSVANIAGEGVLGRTG